MSDDNAAPGAKPAWLVTSEAIIQKAKEAPTNPATSPAITAADWFKQGADQGVDPLDPRLSLRPEHITDMAVRFHIKAPHGGHEQWLEMLRHAAKHEAGKFFGPPTSPEVEIERLRKLPGAGKLAEINKKRNRK